MFVNDCHVMKQPIRCSDNLMCFSEWASSDNWYLNDFWPVTVKMWVWLENTVIPLKYIWTVNTSVWITQTQDGESEKMLVFLCQSWKQEEEADSTWMQIPSQGFSYHYMQFRFLEDAAIICVSIKHKLGHTWTLKTGAKNIIILHDHKR